MRPRTLDDMEFEDESQRSILRGLLQTPNAMPNMVFASPPGVGKTTLAGVLAHEMNGPKDEDIAGKFFVFNASTDRGIQFIRDVVKPISMTKPTQFGRLFGLQDHKQDIRQIIFLDESDKMTTEAQESLRYIMEHSSAIFIFAINKTDSKIDGIMSRSHLVLLKPLSIQRIVHRLGCILEKQKVQPLPEPGVLEHIAEDCCGDLRTAIRVLQQLVDSCRIPTLIPITLERSYMILRSVPRLMQLRLCYLILHAKIDQSACRLCMEWMDRYHLDNRWLMRFYEYIVLSIVKYAIRISPVTMTTPSGTTLSTSSSSQSDSPYSDEMEWATVISDLANIELVVKQSSSINTRLLNTRLVFLLRTFVSKLTPTRRYTLMELLKSEDTKLLSL